MHHVEKKWKNKNSNELELTYSQKGKIIFFFSFSIHTSYISSYTQIFLKVFNNTKIALLYKFS